MVFETDSLVRGHSWPFQRPWDFYNSTQAQAFCVEL